MPDITLISHRFVLARIMQLFRQALQTPDWGHIKCWCRDCHLEFCWSWCVKQCVKY